MSHRPLAPARSIALLLTVLAGTAFSAPALADDGGAADAPQPAGKPAAKADTKTETKTDAKADAKTDAKETNPAEDAKAQHAKDVEMLADFEHYVIIDRADVAKSVGQGLLDRHFSPSDFAALVDSTSGAKRFFTATSKAGRQPGLDAISSQLQKLYENGQLAAARDPQAIAANVKLLVGTPQQQFFARDRLLFAGEYAMPQLFTTYFGGSDVELNAKIRGLFIELGRHSVMPLVTALPQLTPTQQSQVCSILGDMPQYTQSLPFLYELAQNSKEETARTAATAAIRRISATPDMQMPLADRYNDLADAYYKASPSLVTFPNDPNQLVWSYQPGTGLVFQAVDTQVFPQTMAMKLSEKALQVDSTSSRAVATWIAADFSREIRSPEGYENPVYGKDRREAMYYAVAAGPSVDQAVLGKALDSSDTPLIRKAIASVEKTGGRDLWSATTGRRPLLEALRYPNRRVQYETALAIGAAQPKDAFDGAETVVRTLGSSIRDASAKYALIVAPDTERQSTLSDLFRAKGFTVLPPTANLNDVRQAIADVPGVDIIVSSGLPSQQTDELITQAQSDSRLRATPILTLVTIQGYQDLYPRFARNIRVRILREGIGPTEVENAASDLINVASGGLISGAEADSYKARSLSVLRDLAMANSPIFNVSEAQGPLIAAVADSKGDTRYRIAEVLSLLSSKQAQVSLADAALNADPAERTKLLGLVADSAKRFGNQLEKRQVDALVDLTSKAQGEEATAAAAVVGALNLQGMGVVPLILGDKK